MATQSSSGNKLSQFLTSFCSENNVNACIFTNFPRRWEKYGDLVLLTCRNFASPEWLSLPAEFWTGVCKVFHCQRLAMKGTIQSDGLRTPQVTMIVGDNPWALHKDNGVFYTWNVHTNMFCAGNAPERHRIAKLDCSNEVVADLFAGIGYFTIPYLVHANAAFVYACDWNPAAVIALKKNLILNKVEKRCEIFEEDNKKLNLDDIADRVNLGLIPSSELSWPIACRALKQSGGVLSIHGNVETLKPYVKCERCPDHLDCDTIKWKHANWQLWNHHVLHKISELMVDIRGFNYECITRNVHCVKSYAPHVYHIVLDVCVRRTDNHH